MRMFETWPGSDSWSAPHYHCYCRTAVTATPSTPSTRTSRSAPRCSTSAGGGAADGRLCGSAKTVTPSKVQMMTWWHDDMTHDDVTHDDMMTMLHRLLTIYFVTGCPVRHQSCNTTSPDPEINNVLTKETAYTFSMCSGRYYSSGVIMQQIANIYIYTVYFAF